MQKRVMGAFLLVLGLVLILVGSNTHAWWTFATDHDGSGGFGLQSLQGCNAFGHCESVSWFELFDKKGNADTVGTIAFAAGTAAFFGAFAIAISAIVTLAVGFVPSGGSRLPSRITTGLVILMLVCTIVFMTIIMVRKDGSAPLTIGYSSFVYLTGSVGAVIGALMLAPSGVATSSIASTSLSAGSAVPACPRCGAPTDWVSQHNRFMCAKCRIYV